MSTISEQSLYDRFPWSQPVAPNIDANDIVLKNVFGSISIGS
jgi:hypothetical protein